MHSDKFSAECHNGNNIFLTLGPRIVVSDGGETFLWQLEGSSKISFGNREFRLIIDDVLLIPVDASYQVNSSKDGITLSCKMSINNKFRA